MTEDFDDTARRMSDDYWAAKFTPLIPERARDQARAEIEHLVAEARKGQQRQAERKPKQRQAARKHWQDVADAAAKLGDKLRADEIRKEAAINARMYNTLIEGSARRRDALREMLYTDIFRIWTDVAGGKLTVTTSPVGDKPSGVLIDFVSAITWLVMGEAKPDPETIKKASKKEVAYRDECADVHRALKAKGALKAP
jgi:hypothetical protein